MPDNGIELAKAYVQIVPSAEGISGSLSRIMEGEGAAAGEKAGKAAGGSFGSVLAGAGKAAIAGVTAAAAAGAAAAGRLVRESTEAYADYEQLVGGIETLFGDSANAVLERAGEAYKTAGMDANAYMETTIQSAAAMINALGGDQARAAELSDMAITDMSDNVNKMGTSVQAVQDAYRGFSRGNFTMLDNLALGFAGTREGMQQLLDKAQEVSGVKFDISSYADIVQAIHVVQREMGITGTTAQEAGATISGSLASAKSAWQNLIVGVADENAQFDVLVDNFVSSATTVGENLIPRIAQSIEGVGKLIEGLAPAISNAIGTLIPNVLPSLTQAGWSVVQAVSKAILDNAGEIVQAGLGVIASLASGIADALPELVPQIVDVVVEIVDVLTDPDTLSRLIEGALAIIVALGDGLIKSLPRLIQRIPEIIKNLVSAIVSNAPQMLKAALELIVQLGSGLIQAIPQLLTSIPQIISAIVNGLAQSAGMLVDVGKQLMNSLWQGVNSVLDWIGGKISGKFKEIWDWVVGLFKSLGEKLDSSAQSFSRGWNSYSSYAVGAITGTVSSGYANPARYAAAYAKQYSSTTNNYNVNIDAHSVREFNDVVNAAQNAQRFGRMYA